jgi:hypothetical protein
VVTLITTQAAKPSNRFFMMLGSNVDNHYGEKYGSVRSIVKRLCYLDFHAICGDVKTHPLLSEVLMELHLSRPINCLGW